MGIESCLGGGFLRQIIDETRPESRGENGALDTIIFIGRKLRLTNPLHARHAQLVLLAYVAPSSESVPSRGGRTPRIPRTWNIYPVPLAADQNMQV
jgi:hypothetical protein